MDSDKTTTRPAGRMKGERTMYNLIDTHTNKIIKTYKSRKAAREAARKLDWEYGAARYVVMIAR